MIYMTYSFFSVSIQIKFFSFRMMDIFSVNRKIFEKYWESRLITSQEKNNGYISYVTFIEFLHFT